MTPVRAVAALLTVAAVSLTAAPAGAQTVLLKDDAEGALEALWVAGQPASPLIQPWQKSDSTAVKLRGNQAHGGATSYWAGSQPQDFQPSDVVTGEATLTTKQSIVIPADGRTTISAWSLFQNEGDDQGLIEAAVDSGGKLDWKKVTAVKLGDSAVGDVDFTPGYCDVTHPADVAQQGFDELKGGLDQFAGQKVFIRFNLKYGSENRIPTMPCGWYVDDIAVNTTGTAGKLGGATQAVTTPALPPASTKVALRLRTLRVKRKTATIALTVARGELQRVKVALLNGAAEIATAEAPDLARGSRAVALDLPSRLRRGAYTVKVSGADSEGAPYTATKSFKVK